MLLVFGERGARDSLRYSKHCERLLAHLDTHANDRASLLWWCTRQGDVEESVRLLDAILDGLREPSALELGGPMRARDTVENSECKLGADDK